MTNASNRSILARQLHGLDRRTNRKVVRWMLAVVVGFAVLVGGMVAVAQEGEPACPVNAAPSWSIDDGLLPTLYPLGLVPCAFAVIPLQSPARSSRK
jgi:hypothetical protein